MTDILGSCRRFNSVAFACDYLRQQIGEGRRLLGTPTTSQARREWLWRVLGGLESCPDDIDSATGDEIAGYGEAALDYLESELRAIDPDAPPPAPPEKVDYPAPEIIARSTVVATLSQLSRAAGHEEPARRFRRPVVVRLPSAKGEPVSRRLMVRLARPEASRAPPSGNDDDHDSDDPDPDRMGASTRAFFVVRRRP